MRESSIKSNMSRINVYEFVLVNGPTLGNSSLSIKHNTAILVKGGKGKLTFDGIPVRVEAGSLVFGFVGETLVVEADAEFEYLRISFDGIGIKELFIKSGINRITRHYPSLYALIPLWYESYFHAMASSVELSAESILLYTFSRLMGISGEQSKLVDRIIYYTEKNFSDPNLSISIIAKKLSYNANYISHGFKKQMGMSYSEYLRTFRINYAVSLLNEGNYSVKSVAFMCGFSDQLYFSTVFKKIVGISPREYKNKIANQMECEN